MENTHDLVWYKEFARQLKEMRDKLSAENEVLKDKLHRRNMQIEDLKKVKVQRIEDLMEVSENRQQEIMKLQDKLIDCLSIMTAEQKAKLTK
jgi:predicted RNase H-like nuclease (RuvC/YqgF family)